MTFINENKLNVTSNGNLMNNKILITGGTRSGKSIVAENLILTYKKKPVYIATAKIFDNEMAKRISKHKDRRSQLWIEYEAYTNLVEVINKTDHLGPRLVDCLTMWLNNLIFEKIDWKSEVSRLVECLVKQQQPIILVTNEVGSGIIPENKLARQFSDIVGETNSIIASNVDAVFLVVSGVSLKIKG